MQQRNGFFYVVHPEMLYAVTCWSNELAVRQLPAGKNVTMEAEDVVGIRHQTMTGEDTAD
jgi:hypothetical protein